MSNAKKLPQDRKPKGAIDDLRREASRLPGMDSLAGRSITVEGRRGKVTVTTFENPLDWDAEVMGLLRDGDYLGAIIGMVSDEDGLQLRAIRPPIAAMLAALAEPDEESGEPSVGEPQAS